MREICKEYAAALFALGCECGEESALMSDLETMRSLFEQNGDYAVLLSSPAIPLGERLCAVRAALEGHFFEHAVSFVLLLCEKGHARSFDACVTEYRRLLDERNAVVVARVRSAVELTDGQKAALKAKLEKTSGASVTLQCTVDPSLIGGVAVEMDGRIMDGSVRRRLQRIKEVMNT